MDRHNIKTIDKLQGNIGERKHINAENVNKQSKDEEKYTQKNVITKKYVTQEH
jgi:hypothetical protein